MLDVLICVLQRMMKITERLRMNSKQLFSFFFLPWSTFMVLRCTASLSVLATFRAHFCRACLPCCCTCQPSFFFLLLFPLLPPSSPHTSSPPPPFSVSHNRAFLRKGRGESIVTAASKKMRIKMLWLFPYACLFVSQLGKRKSRRER